MHMCSLNSSHVKCEQTQSNKRINFCNHPTIDMLHMLCCRAALPRCTSLLCASLPPHRSLAALRWGQRTSFSATPSSWVPSRKNKFADARRERCNGRRPRGAPLGIALSTAVAAMPQQASASETSAANAPQHTITTGIPSFPAILRRD